MLILAGIVFLGILILNIIFTYLLVNKVDDINNKVRQMNISSQERERELNLKDSIVSTEGGRVELEKYFIPAGDVATVNFTKFLEALALETGVSHEKTLNYEVVKDMEKSEIVSAVRFRFNISGSWSNVFKFIQLVESLPKISYINNVSFYYSPEGKNWSAALDFSVVKLKN